MLPILNAASQFTAYEHSINAAMSALTLLAYFYAYRTITKLGDHILKEIERWFMVLCSIHVFFQLLYHFLVAWPIFYYLSQIILYIELICIVDTFTTHLEGLSARLKGLIENVAKYGTIGVLVLGVLTVFWSKGDNDCGQSLFAVNLFIYTLIAAMTIVELIYIVRKKNERLSNLCEDRSFDLGKQLVQELQAKQENLKMTKQFRAFFLKLLYTVCIGYVTNMILHLYKCMPVVFEGKTCIQIFEDKSILFAVIFSLSEFIGFNLINLFVFNEYFWSKRYEFCEPSDKLALTDMYDQNRSGYIMDLDDNDNMVEHRNQK